MTDPMNAPPPPPPSSAEFGSWGARVGAYVLDILPIAVLYTVVALIFGDNSAGGGAVSTSLTGLPAVVVFVLGVGWLVYNWGVKQGATGQTMGKKVLNIAVYKAGTTETLGTGLSFGRYLVHIIDAIPCYIGFLWPLWDKENRTFTDMILDTRVYKA